MTERIAWHISAASGTVVITGGGLKRPWEITLQEYDEMGWRGMSDSARAAKLVAAVLKEVRRRELATLLPEGRHDRGWPRA